MADEIADIIAARDEQVRGTDACFARLRTEIASYKTSDEYLASLALRMNEVLSERSRIRRVATDAVLALPEVVSAAKRLTALGEQMTKVAAQMVTAKDVLGTATKVISNAKKFGDIVVTQTKEKDGK